MTQKRKIIQIERGKIAAGREWQELHEKNYTESVISGYVSKKYGRKIY